jgi:hypothetical protein
VRYVLLPVLLLVALATGQQWEFELIEACSARRASVRRHPVRGAVVGYETDGQYRLAWKDSVWHYDSTSCSGMADSCIGPDGTTGIAYLPSDSVRLRYAVRTDSGWQHESLPWRTDGGRPWLGIGPEGLPGILHTIKEEGPLNALLLAVRTQDSWRLDTLWAVDGTPGAFFDAFGFAYDTIGRACGLYKVTTLMPTWIEELHIFADSGGTCLLSGYENHVSGVLGLEPGGKWAALYANADGLVNRLYYSDSEPGSGLCLDSLAGAGAVTFDPAGRPFALYAKDANLYFSWRTDKWRKTMVPRQGIGSADLIASDSCEPLIAFTDAQGVWLARGTGIVDGIAEKPMPQVAGPKREATILSDKWGVEHLASCVVYDALGRRVTSPRPGIFFVRQASSIMRDASSVTKVVITR